VRADASEIDVAASPLRRSPRARLHIFAGGSTRREQQVVESAERSVAHARRTAPELELQLSAVDSTRCQLAFLTELACAAARAGATTIGLTDTLGATLPADVAAMVAHVRAAVPAHVTLSFHGHDDLGLATDGGARGAGRRRRSAGGLRERPRPTRGQHAARGDRGHPRGARAPSRPRHRRRSGAARPDLGPGRRAHRRRDRGGQGVVGAHATPADLDAIVGR
jgi:hypothetical protein